MKLRIVAIAALVLAPTVICQSTQAQPPQANGAAVKSDVAADEPTAAIQKTAIAFADAFKRADAKAIAALWTANGEYIDETGAEYAGPEAIEKRYAEFFQANPGASIALEVD